ncbi:uncharacterized protein NFIA_009260 [Aspergillus fischeri NRRL 181]|uniref:NAD-dependent epimerase/dehydratase domain-containing protein n=1 Tax=Neosartorya fischeri (strain ATCC 1020 / DSM 3700 / CBS 544.65 / FGSC A1164 / JCM 1740 / NRRL 181 / WB 181) TaxID=331117 RepID=A1D1F4_NEOFI|nr:uncharacterized protein NFIA_009260 [Aspergillus fischeri NRRL 181]EAW22247.1 hypothetical protein NFIA_009260 [Aspergillus fischeri NRRL 181]
MARVLLTGGNGFLGSHVLGLLLDRGYSVVTTVRSLEKAEQIRECHHLHASTTQLRVIIVPDFTSAGAFDECFKSDAPLDVVIHTASPFRYSITDIQRELLNPAIGGTVALLEAVRKSAPSVKKVVRFPHRSEMKQTYLASVPEVVLTNCRS